MDGEINFQHCRGWSKCALVPPGVKCPPELTYPTPPASPIEMLFLAWNPPSSKHFWNNSTDNLRTHLRWVLSQEPFSWKQPDFLSEFLSRECFLVHAARCWADPAWPPVEVAKTCARALLGKDIQAMQPKTLCILGRIPLYAAREVIPGLPHPEVVQYREGHCVEIAEMKVIITVLPHHYDRQHTLNALRLRWT